VPSCRHDGRQEGEVGETWHFAHPFDTLLTVFAQLQASIYTDDLLVTPAPSPAPLSIEIAMVFVVDGFVPLFAAKPGSAETRILAPKYRGNARHDIAAVNQNQ